KRNRLIVVMQRITQRIGDFQGIAHVFRLAVSQQRQDRGGGFINRRQIAIRLIGSDVFLERCSKGQISQRQAQGFGIGALPRGDGQKLNVVQQDCSRTRRLRGVGGDSKKDLCVGQIHRALGV